MNVTLRYWLFQLPGLALAALVLTPLVYYGLIELETAALIWSLWLIKDAALYPLLRDAYTVERRQGAEALVGREGVVETELAPRGWLRIRGELWQAKVAEERDRLSRGAKARVVAVEGMLLFVERPRDESKPGDAIYADE